jgi:hypothetical protein
MSQNHPKNDTFNGYVAKENMTREHLRHLFPLASQEFLDKNADAIIARSNAEEQSAARGASTGILEKKKAQSHEQDIRTKGSRKASKLECTAGDGTLGQDQGQEGSPERLHIRIESVRKRLLDPDNISEKAILDCLRYVGAIPGDQPDQITLETTQRKCEKGEEEHTLIQIFEP